MNLYELHHTINRQAELLDQASTDRWLSEYRSGHPSLGQRTIIAAGAALVSAGGWLQRQGGSRSHVHTHQGMPALR